MDTLLSLRIRVRIRETPSRDPLLDPKVIAILKRTVTLGERISVHRPQEELGRVFEGAL